MTKFQYLILTVFGLFILGGLMLFALHKASDAKSQQPPVAIWGTANSKLMKSLIKQLDGANSKITYEEHRADTFDQELLQALALGRGPDVILVTQDNVFKNMDKLITIPYSNYPEATYKTSFVEGTEVYLNSNGLLAVPFSVDPLVMYWNRDIFNNNTLTQAPETWDQFADLTQILTRKDRNGNITQSAVGLGEADNIDHAKEILSALMFQLRNPITALSNGVNPRVIMSDGNSAAAFDFFTKFANPSNESYTWNKSLPSSRDLFVQNRLAIYFGYASEASEIQQKNPNLNFDIALLPQIKPTTAYPNPLKATFGNMYAFSVTIGSRNAAAALAAILKLTTKEGMSIWSQESGLAPLRRDSIVIDPAKSSTSVFATSVLWSRAWMDPDGNGSTQIFKQVVNSITSGQSSIEAALGDAQNRLQLLYPQQ
jgi:ABC-type glycerol-3-phosphate transport system substrate-binding protein